MLHGVDVSSYQAANYATSGLSFVFIKLTEGLSYVNPKWTAQRTTARKAGLVTGFYHYPHIPNSPTAEADHFLARIDLRAGDILCLDWEWYGQKVSDARARSYKDTWLKHVKSKAPSHRVVLYCDRSNWLDVDTDSYCCDGLWIADPTTAGHPRVKHHWTFHQYSSSSIDKDVANFSSTSALHSWAGVPKHAATAVKAEASVPPAQTEAPVPPTQAEAPVPPAEAEAAAPSAVPFPHHAPEAPAPPDVPSRPTRPTPPKPAIREAAATRTAGDSMG